MGKRKRNPDPTPTQMRVLRWAYYGKSNKDIAALLGLSNLTVKNHIQALLKKAGCWDRTRLVTVALEKGWLTMSPLAEVRNVLPSGGFKYDVVVLDDASVTNLKENAA